MTAVPAQQRPATVNPMTAIGRKLTQYVPVLERINPDRSPERTIADVAQAIRLSENARTRADQGTLLACTEASLVGATVRAHQLGLAPNDWRNLIHFIPRRNKKGQWECNVQLGYGGVLELARRAEPGVTFEGHIVYPNDVFDPGWTDDQPFTHTPYYTRRGAKAQDPGGEPVAWYVVASYPDGRRHRHVLTRPQVEYHRSFSGRPNEGMWKDSYDAAALKSAVMDMARWLPMSQEMNVARTLIDAGVHNLRDVEAELGETPQVHDELAELEDSDQFALDAADEDDEGRPFTDDET